MGYKSFCCLLLLLTGNVSLLAQGIDDISPMAIYNIGLVGCDSIGVNVLKTFISTGEARCVAVFDEKTTLAESTEREITSIQDKAPLLYNDRTAGANLEGSRFCRTRTASPEINRNAGK